MKKEEITDLLERLESISCNVADAEYWSTKDLQLKKPV